MKFARSLTVKWRLIGFVLFLLMLIIGAGLGGLNGMRSVNESLSEVYEDQVLPIDELREIDYLFQYRIVGTIDKTLFEQISWAEGLKTIKDSNKTLKKKWAKLYATGDGHNGTREMSWLAPSKKLIIETDATVKKLTLYLENNDIDSLDVFTDEKLYPLAEQHRQTINLLIKDRLLAVKKTYEKAQSNFVFSKNVFFITILVGFVISVIASYILIASIDTPLRKIINAMKQVI